MRPMVEDVVETAHQQLGWSRRKLARSRALKRAERQSRQLKLDAFGGTKPMKVGKRRADVRRNASNDPCCSTEHWLQTAQKIAWYTCQSRVASPILTTQDTLLYRWWWQRSPNVWNLTECSEAARGSLHNVGSHRQINVNLDTEVTDRRRWWDYLRADSNRSNNNNNNNNIRIMQ